eukprot:CAMPEP_0179135400 /NCGR_PEP_ID=MMETSP0796-20121207/64468_1 /TAXON_ID=73915 /ORGANISM="Pyrodinium bahamense, Strain pbaha01" /LENGTH=551 /DNA_ID=CAMNT_0020834425 /DNA_START=60 /DNA_END=1712 /DNA_ORIENTATION=-
MEPQEDVYTYLMFMIPIEQARAKSKERAGFAWGSFLAYLIVVVAVTLQSVLIYNIFHSIVLGDMKWQLSVSRPFAGCNTGGSLCSELNGEYTCAPPSVQLASRWDELDADHDGIWTREEVEAAREGLKCKYNVDPVEAFDVYVNILLGWEEVLWIHPDVRSGKAIPRAYFVFAAGDVIMCSHRTSDMCPNLLMRGMWDAPLRYNSSRRVGNTITSALKYCRGLLEEGGRCEQMLPSAFAVWKKSSDEQCVGAGYSKVTYQHPVTNRTKSLLAVDYEVLADYKRVDEEFEFRIYKACVIGIYLLAMLFDLKSITMFATFVVKFPSAAGQAEPVTEEAEDDDPTQSKYTIHGITQGHRACMGVLVLVRFVMFVALTVVGLLFLLRTMSVLDLILNGLGLLFVVEISNIVYTQMLGPFLKQEFQDARPLKVPMLYDSLPMNRNPALKDLLWFSVLAAALVLGMYLYKVLVTDPMTTALKCACLSQGETCREAQLFDKAFWEKYWSQDIPAVFRAVDEMRQTGSTHVPLAALMTGSARAKRRMPSGRAAGQALQH